MARSDTHLKYLGEVPLFSTCSTRELRKIAMVADEVTVEAGRVIVAEGSFGREAYVVTEGEAIVRRSKRKIATMGPGDHFGELALLDGGARTATVTAETPMKLLVLRQGEFFALLDDVPKLVHTVMANLATQIRDLDSKVYA